MEEQKKVGVGRRCCLSWRFVGVPDFADGNLAVLSCLCWIAVTCPTRVFLPLFSTLPFAPGGCISQALLPSGFSWAWLIRSPSRIGGDENNEFRVFISPTPSARSWLCFFTKADCSSQDSYSTQLTLFQFLVISPSYWQRLLGSSS